MSTALAPDDVAIDHALADVSDTFRLLLDVTPVNVETARERFDADAADEPAFEYRPLEDDPAVLHAELDRVDVASVSDAAVAHFAQAKRRELELQIEMLRARGTAAFRALSVELYGTVTPALLSQAHDVLAELEPTATRREATACLDAEALARLAETELDHYRETEPDLSAHVEIRADTSGVMVTGGNVLIGRSAQVAASRAN